MRRSEEASSELEGAILASRPSYKELKERVGKSRLLKDPTQ